MQSHRMSSCPRIRDAARLGDGLRHAISPGASSARSPAGRLREPPGLHRLLGRSATSPAITRAAGCETGRAAGSATKLSVYGGSVGDVKRMGDESTSTDGVDESRQLGPEWQRRAMCCGACLDGWWDVS